MDDEISQVFEVSTPFHKSYQTNKRQQVVLMYMLVHVSHLNCSSMLNLCRKLPPNTRESSGVNTAWIQPIHVHVLRGILSLK